MKRGGLRALQVRPFPRDEVGIVGKWGGEGRPITPIPSVNDAVMNGEWRPRQRQFEQLAVSS